MRKITAAAPLLSLFCGLFLPILCRAQEANQSLPLSKTQWHEDLQYLARELPKRHKNLFYTVSREQFERMVAELDMAIPALADYQIIVRMLQITAKGGDGHTYVHLPQTFKRYPTVLLVRYWTARYSRPKEYKEALGTKVVKVGGVNISDVQTRLLSVSSQDENEWFVLNNSPGDLENDEINLPNSHLVVSHSTRYYKFLDEDARAVMPDKRIDPNWPDYKAGRNSVMDWILSYVSE
jgi:hypothetical protein